MHIEKGSGTFRLVKVMRGHGYLHVSFYPVPSGSAFGGVYFGQGEGVLKHKGWSYLDTHARSPDYTTAASPTGEPVSLAGPNRTLLEYLGDPVEPPADMDTAYTKDGLTQALQTAAQNAGISLKRIVIDDSEYPFLVGVECNAGDYPKLKEQLRKMPAYDYGGGVSSDTLAAINLVPYRVFPSESSKRINHRTMLREAVLYDRMARKP